VLRLGVSSLAVLPPALLPLLLVAPRIYPWLQPDFALPNRFWLNGEFAAWRVLAYLVVWCGLALLLRRPHPRLAPPGLILLAITFTFASIDLTMSLDPHFKSSAYGMIAAAASALLALSVALLVVAALASEEVVADLARLLLGLTILWAYLDFMQLLIVWQSDLQGEAPWYVARGAGGWGWLAGLLALGHFVLPFLLLLSPRGQRQRGRLMAVAALLVAMEILRGWWLVLPAQSRLPGWIDLACLLTLAGCGGGVMLRVRARVGGRQHV
jgi:hypothetical protein